MSTDKTIFTYTSNPKAEIFWYILLTILVAIPLFGAMEKMPIRLWDESRLAINAYEMSKSGSWLIPTFDGQPDMWNTKPPLVIWLQAIAIRNLGLSPIAIRLPIALACYCTCIVLFRWLSRYSKDYLFALISVLVLVSTLGYIREHVARTGDYDGMLVLFTTASSLAFFSFLEFGNKKHIYLFFVFLSLAVLTKSVAGLMLLPGLGIYTLFRKKVKMVFTTKETYIGLLIFLLPVVAYYLFRSHYNPGYWDAVLKNELGGRFFEVTEAHQHPFLWYFDNMWEQYNPHWFMLFVCGAVLGCFHEKEWIKKVTQYSIIVILSFFVVISSSSTKLLWYDAPLYPFMAIVTAVPIYSLISFISTRLNQSVQKRKGIVIGLLFLVFSIPYTQVVLSVVHYKEIPAEASKYYYTQTIHSAMKGDVDINNHYIIIDDYRPNVVIYIAMAQNKGLKIAQKGSHVIEVGDLIIVDDENIKKTVESRYNLAHIAQYDNTKSYRVMGLKDGQ